MVIDYLDLARRLAGRNIKNDADMPPAYRSNQRPLHDDWGIFPFTLIPRKLTTYRLPMPSKKFYGNAEPVWTPYQEGYPLAPDTEIRIMPWWDGVNNVELQRPHILSMQPVHEVGQWSVQGVYLDGEWRPCYYTSSTKLFGKRLYTNRGLKPDVTLGDFAWNFPEASLTWR